MKVLFYCTFLYLLLSRKKDNVLFYVVYFLWYILKFILLHGI